MRAVAESLDAYGASSKESAGTLEAVLARRVASLQDDPRTTLFFGRIDFPQEVLQSQAPSDTSRGPRKTPHEVLQSQAPSDTSRGPRKTPHEVLREGDASSEDSGRWYIGRRHVSDEAGTPVVVDWRAPVSTAFYRASHTEPMRVTLRRRFGVDHGVLTAIEDEHLSQPREPEAHSGILAAEIERPRTGPMRDIVSTIQPEQDEIVRADVTQTICVQGAPGTGKTAVGLHRAAWLLYTFRDRLDRTGVLVIGPNKAFLEHIRAVLPALGEVRVRHSTLSDLLSHGRVRGTEPTSTAVLKGDARMAEVVRRAVWARVGTATEPLIVPRGIHKWRVPAYEVREIVEELRTRGVRYDAARAMLPQRLAHAVLLRMERAGDSPDDRVQDAVGRCAAMKSYVKALWPALDPAEVLFRLLADADALDGASEGLLADHERLLLLWDRAPASKGSARWTGPDMALLDEVGDQLTRTPSLGHIILDEAQDLSPMQLRAVGRRCSTGSMTVLGDIAQGTTPWATDSWETSMTHLGHPDHHLEVLNRGFRVPATVLELATRLLPAMAPQLPAPTSVRDNPGRLTIEPTTPRQLTTAAVSAVAGLLTDLGSVGVIVPDGDLRKVSNALQQAQIDHADLSLDEGDEQDHRVQLVPASVAKGLEFDHVLVLEPAAIVAAEPDRRTGLRRLYVVLTRTVSSLTVLHCAPLPPELNPTPEK
ncbi:AAA family ATPase [Leekyejoonella antrihumi]|uniref:AAA family ATPase n=2 Tax=Leekyejoonella antrihumi TaxID=1660198 RepID=A0A563DZ37_9MICO|nr:AAA family ATPase [Leekyejoonella antrihumi]